MVEIDGSYGEGGGQIIRSSVSLAAMTGKEVRIKNVRANRDRPGLQPQHLMAVRAAAQICSAHLEGAEPGSMEFTFRPGHEVMPGKYVFDIGTAGATTLVAQTVLLPLALTKQPSEVTVMGGTYNPMAPPADYVEQVYIPALAAVGLKAGLRTEQAGYYPRGGGRIELAISPSALKPVNFVERGSLVELQARVVTSRLPPPVSQRGRREVEERLHEFGVHVRRIDLHALSAGAAVFVCARFQNGIGGFTGLGARNKPMENVAREACDEFLLWRKTFGAVDEHLADQLVLPMCFAKGESRWRTSVATEHLKTMAWLIPHFLSRKVIIDGNEVTVR